MSVSILYARGIVAEIQRRDLDVDALLRRARLDHARLADVREMLEIEEMDQLTTAAVELSGDAAVALAAGANAPEHTAQLFGYLVLAQPTLREACATVEHYTKLLADGTEWRLREQGDAAFWTWSSVLDDRPLRRMLAEYTFAFGMRLGRHFFRPGEKLRSVHFRHAAPPYAERYEAVFHCPVHFAQTFDGTCFARAQLDRPQPHGDAVVSALLRQSAEQLLEERLALRSVGDSVRTLLKHESDLSQVDARRVATHLKVSVHTLRRRLHAEGLSLAALLDEARCRRACEALRRRDVPIQAISEQLGFSEASAFFRAFKRWTGRTPATFRREHFASILRRARQEAGARSTGS